MEQPYIIKKELVETKHYNPNYGDYKFCECGHSYFRHFDSYDPFHSPIGCKYCECEEFKEVPLKIGDKVVVLMGAYNNVGRIGTVHDINFSTNPYAFQVDFGMKPIDHGNGIEGLCPDMTWHKGKDLIKREEGNGKPE
jgi:hypothetical protein